MRSVDTRQAFFHFRSVTVVSYLVKYACCVPCTNMGLRPFFFIVCVDHLCWPLPELCQRILQLCNLCETLIDHLCPVGFRAQQPLLGAGDVSVSAECAPECYGPIVTPIATPCLWLESMNGRPTAHPFHAVPVCFYSFSSRRSEIVYRLLKKYGSALALFMSPRHNEPCLSPRRYDGRESLNVSGW